MISNELLESIQNEYIYIDDIFNEDDIKIKRIKKIVAELDEADRVIILLYSELKSLRKVGAALGISHTIIYREIQRIREIIISKI